jgi:hypothetical protein
MADPPFTMLGSSRLGVEPHCPACRAGASVWFNWRFANERRSPEDLSRIAHFLHWKDLRRGVLYRCRLCDEVWHLDGDAEQMTHVQSERLALVLDWNRETPKLSTAVSARVERIGPTPPDVYGNGKERRVTPCAVMTHSGDQIETAMICVQRDAPVGDHMRFRLGSEIAKVSESPFALSRAVREASSRADEMRMGFSPTLIEMPDGRRFVMNGMTSFMAVQGYAASDARVVSGSFFSEHLTPSIVETPDDLIYFIVDGDPGWVANLSTDVKPVSGIKRRLRILLRFWDWPAKP